MNLKRNFFLALLVFVVSTSTILFLPHQEMSAGFSPVSRPELELAKSDRILIMAPHPDDEVFNCAGIIHKAQTMGLPLKILFLTNGDSYEWDFILYRKHPVISQKGAEAMGEVRYEEALAASKVMGVSPDHLVFLGYPDLGTLNIWYSYWGNIPPYESILTRVTSVPYKYALRPGAPYDGGDVLQDIEDVLRDFRPTKIFVSHPGDYHPDHQAFYLFTSVALWNLENEIKPEIYSYITHFKDWPSPKGYFPQEKLEPPPLYEKEAGWYDSHLTPEEINLKLNAIKAHKSQYGSSEAYLYSFVRENELFQKLSDIVLAPEISPPMGERREYLKTKPEQLIDIEKTSFVYIGSMSVQMKKEMLVIKMKLTQPLPKDVGASVYIFGYRRDSKFEDMPKLHFKFGTLTESIYDGKKELPKEKFQIERQNETITIRVPLGELGESEKIFISARTYQFEVPIEWVSWRVLVIPPTVIQPFEGLVWVSKPFGDFNK